MTIRWQASAVVAAGMEKFGSAGARSLDASPPAYGAVKVHVGETGTAEWATPELHLNSSAGSLGPSLTGPAATAVDMAGTRLWGQWERRSGPLDT